MAELKELVAIRRALTDKKSELTNDFNKQIAKLQEMLVDVETQIRASMNAAGLKSARTDAGTVTLRTSTKYNVSDWEEIDALVKETGDTSFYQRRLSTTRLRQYLDEGNDMPEGIVQQDMIEVSITKPKD